MVSEFASPKSISILAYFVPPSMKKTVPVFFDIASLQLLQLNGSTSSDPYECYKVLARTLTVPLLFCFARTDSVAAMWRRFTRFLRISAGNRVLSNLNNQKASSQYDRAYAQVLIPVGYFQKSIFFDVEAENEEGGNGETETGKTTDGETKEAKEEEKGNDAAEDRNEEEKTAETASSEPSSQAEPVQSNAEEAAEASETPKAEASSSNSEQPGEETKEEGESSIPPLKFPLFFATSLSEMSQPFFNLSSMQRVTNDASPLLSLFSEVNTKTDYRCVLLSSSLASSQIQSSFEVEGSKNKNEVVLALVKAVCLEPSLVCYSEESLESDRKRKEESTQLSLYDCLELKKTSSVLLTGSKYAALPSIITQ